MERASRLKITEAGQSEAVQAARKELDELKGRYDEIMRDLVEATQHRSPNWQIKTYAIESLCAHVVSQSDWDSMSSLLLNHADPVVRALTA